MLFGVLITAFPDDNPYAHWHRKRIRLYYDNYARLRKDLRLDTRMNERHGYDFMIPKWLNTKMKPGDVVVLPPHSYAKSNKMGAAWTDVRIFMYMAGLRPVIMADDTARFHHATHFLELGDGGTLWYRKIDSPEERDSVRIWYDELLRTGGELQEDVNK